MFAPWAASATDIPINAMGSDKVSFMPFYSEGFGDDCEFGSSRYTATPARKEDERRAV
jgi:hypothetical protein